MFQKADGSNVKLKMALVGASGTGKTYTALQLASGLGKKIAMVDTENGSSQLYSKVFNFDVDVLKDYSPNSYKNAIDNAIKYKYDVLIIDSLSHEWEGTGGILQMVENETLKSQSKNSFTAWKNPSKLHTDLIYTILHAPIHIIVTMRAKSDYVIQEDERGKKSVMKVGLKPIQRDGVEFEFDVVGRFVGNAVLYIEKTRINEIFDRTLAIEDLTPELGKKIFSYLQAIPTSPSNDEVPDDEVIPEAKNVATEAKQVPKKKTQEYVTIDAVKTEWNKAHKKGMTANQWKSMLVDFGASDSTKVTPGILLAIQEMVDNYTVA